MQLHIGQSTLKGPFAQYAQKLDFLELLAEPQRLPKLSKLRQYGEAAPEGFVFSVVLSPAAVGEDDAAVQALDYGLKVCEVLSPRWVVLRSPSTLRPSSSSERRLGAIFASMKEHLEPTTIAWEPRGLWGGASLSRAAERFGVQPVVDARDVSAAPCIYARLMRLGVSARMGSRLLESLALNFLQAEQAFLVVDGGSALPVKREFEELMVEMSQDDGLDESEDDLDADFDEGALSEDEDPGLQAAVDSDAATVLAGEGEPEESA